MIGYQDLVPADHILSEMLAIEISDGKVKMLYSSERKRIPFLTIVHMEKKKVEFHARHVIHKFFKFFLRETALILYKIQMHANSALAHFRKNGLRHTGKFLHLLRRIIRF